MDFLGAVNRILVNNFILKGDDDLINTFSDLQHEATIRVARNSVTTELNSLLSEFPIPYEKASSTLVTVASQRIYTLASDFVRFWGNNPFFYLSTDANERLYEWPGGEDKLRQTHLLYLTEEGDENWWYWNDNTTKQVALFQIPDGVKTYNYDYEKDVAVVNSTDTIPL